MSLTVRPGEVGNNFKWPGRSPGLRLGVKKSRPMDERLQHVARPVNRVVAACRQAFGGALVAIIVYGSQTRGEAREGSDLDVAAIVRRGSEKRLYEKAGRIVAELASGWRPGEPEVFVAPARLKEFLAEREPFHTAEKREGIVVWGRVNMTESSVPFHSRYQGFFYRSWSWEESKVASAKRLLTRQTEDLCSCDTLDWCAIAAKHAVQCNLQMRGLGFTSNWITLERLARSEFGPKIAAAFGRLAARCATEGNEHKVGCSARQAKRDIADARSVLRLYAATVRRFGLSIDSGSRGAPHRSKWKGRQPDG